MILSFSVQTMLPYIRAGVRQAHGEHVGDERVKRQTIRPRGPRAARLLASAREAYWTHPYDLHLWWKSRTPQREHLGTISGGGHIYPITILHSTVISPDKAEYPILRIDGPRGWRVGDAMLFWSPDHGGDEFAREVLADGFDTVEAFRDFFVPRVGDKFEGALFRW